MEILWLLPIGLITGWLAGLIMDSDNGTMGDMAVGVVGAVVGGYLFQVLDITQYGEILGAIITAVIGAIVLIIVLHMLKRAS